MTDFTRSLAIVIGINAYGDGIPPLTTAVKNAARPADMIYISSSWTYPPSRFCTEILV